MAQVSLYHLYHSLKRNADHSGHNSLLHSLQGLAMLAFAGAVTQAALTRHPFPWLY